ncbi:hypothetical protein K7X08_011336 [Anisodus acutangulus]|uniref:DUF3741 domain-containing protein n=1 Tax=Anisodus acutangulus TaxID=402998 RepID=A0A9Q1LYI1_9SOLA|nr:hypothetical protein K7X08_011336 [Anisodus acutangulus]
MKDLSFFQLKNVMGAKMRKGFKSFCNNDTSTSTLNHQTARPVSSPYMMMADNSCATTSDLRLNERECQTTLEEMLLQLDMEERIATREKLNEYRPPHVPHRMSCVNSSDILRTARNALNQYPRFSLDGKDAMYRSSFRDMTPLLSTSTVGARKSVCCNHELRKMDMKTQTQNMPSTIAGERVIWCKPGVVAKLMGLEAMPMSMHRKHNKETISAIIRRQSLRNRAERYEMENKRSRGRRTSCGGRNSRDQMNQNTTSSCSRNGYCVMKPVAMEDYQEVGWPMRGGVLYRNNDAM